MIFYLTLIFACQLIGESLVTFFKLPIPGPVVGMALLFIGLLAKGGIPKDLELTADTLITHLSLLFIPAGVGVLLHAELLATELLPISVALLVSTLLAIAVTGFLMSRLAGNEREGE